MAIISLALDGDDKSLLLNMNENNIRFITAKSITKTAQTAQQKIKSHITETFVLRKKAGGFEKSIVIRPATKSNLQAEVYTMAAFASLQQTGGVAKARSGRLAVPLYGDLREVKPKTKSNSPAGLKGSFLIKLKDGGHAVAVRKNKEMRIMYYLRSIAYVPKRLNMLEIGEETASTAFSLHFQRIFREETT